MNVSKIQFELTPPPKKKANFYYNVLIFATEFILVSIKVFYYFSIHLIKYLKYVIFIDVCIKLEESLYLRCLYTQQELVGTVLCVCTPSPSHGAGGQMIFPGHR